MTGKQNTPTIDAIIEDAENSMDQALVLRENDDDTTSEAARRRSRTWFESNMSPNKATGGKERERERSRKHRSTTSKNQSKSKSKPTNARREAGSARTSDISRSRHDRMPSNRNSDSASSSEEDEHIPDHRNVLAATRARLTSPSMISTYTALTTTTNTSSGSSGSNSTVTQASITKRSIVTKSTESKDPPLSPAVPDAPDVFAFLVDNESILEKDESQSEGESASESESESESESGSGSDGEETNTSWLPSRERDSFVVEDLSIPQDQASSSSSASSSLHGEDEFSLPPADVETDRSSSPDQSTKDHDSEHEPSSPATDPVSAKIASQMAAAQKRQNLYESMPNIQRINTNAPYSPSSALTPRFQPPPPNHRQQPSPSRDDFPVTGYELLASRLSCHQPDSEDGTMIKPMYRKFEALNHRLLLHLQDEISELEEALHALDNADTQARRRERQILPASRRQAAKAGGELQWHKTDVLGKIGYKLAQYNQALSSFNTTQSLNPPDPEDISAYRTYLQTENPIAEAETHFLIPTDDLVSVYSDNLRPTASNNSPSYAASTYSNDAPSPPSTFPSSPASVDMYNSQQNKLTGLAIAIAVSVLVPILTFNVIPGFVGRMTVTLLVGSGVIFALLQSGIFSRRGLLSSESLTCAGIYGGVMIVMAGII